MKWRSYSVAAGYAWMEVITSNRRFSRVWWGEFWQYGIKGNYDFYMNKWFGKEIPLSPKNRRLVEMLDELGK